MSSPSHLGIKALCIIEYDTVSTDAGRSRLRNYLYEHGLETLTRAMPDNVAGCMQYLIQLFTTRETQ
jgi:hypothetical protein